MSKQCAAGASTMAQWVRALAAQSDDISLFPRTHRNGTDAAKSSCCGMCAPQSAYTCNMHAHKHTQ